MRLVRVVYELSSELPKTEQFGLQAQLRRASISIPSNIAEGAARGSRAEYARFVQIARGSLAELDSQLWLCQDLGYVPYDEQLKERVAKLFAMLSALIRSKQLKSGA
jgi:four helix bundle protein